MVILTGDGCTSYDYRVHSTKMACAVFAAKPLAFPLNQTSCPTRLHRRSWNWKIMYTHRRIRASSPSGQIVCSVDSGKHFAELSELWSVPCGPVELRSNQEGLRGLFLTEEATLPEGRPMDVENSDAVEQLLLLAVPADLLLYVSLEPPWRFNPEVCADGHLKALCESSGMLQAKMKLALLLLWATGGPPNAAGIAPKAQAPSPLGLSRAQRMWRAYLPLLPTPEQQTTTVAFTSADATQLQDDTLEAEVGANEVGVDKLWRTLADFAAGTPLGDALGDTPANFRWALATVFERSLTVPFPRPREGPGGAPASPGDEAGGERLMLVLAPFIDMANHSGAADEYGNAMLSYVPGEDDVIKSLLSAQGFSATPRGGMAGATAPSPPEVENSTPQPHLLLTYKASAASAGREACLNYLESADNRDFLRSFGFTIQNNPADQLTLLAMSLAEVTVLQKVFQVASIEEAAGPEGCPVFATYVTIFPNVAGPSTTADEDLPLEEREGAARLMRQCEALLATYPTSLQEDEALLANAAAPASKGGLSARARAAIAFRAEQKRILTQVQLILRLYT